jgi:ADP-heptose:LPS heptosyltransferase
MPSKFDNINATKTGKRVLITRFSALGDIAMTVPVIQKFVEQNPTVSVTVVSIPFMAPLFEKIPNVNFVGADIKGKHKGLKGLIRLANELRELGFDEIADLHNSIRSRIIRYLLRSSVEKTAVIFKDRKGRKELTRPKNKVFKPLTSMHERYAEVFEKLGYNRLDIAKPMLLEKEDLLPELKSILGEKSGVWIGVSPFSQIASKEYPIDLLEESLQLFLKKNNTAKILFFGGKNDLEILDQLEKNISNSINISKHIRFKQEINLIPHLDLMVGMDSFNGHFAAIYGIPVVTIWGATHPYAGFTPFGQPIINSIIPDLKKYPALPSCTHGKNVVKGYEEVMRSIKPEEVAEKIFNILKR